MRSTTLQGTTSIRAVMGWATMLVLVGGCAPTATTPDVVSATTIGGATPGSLVLKSDGIGPYRLGDPAESVIEGISSDIGGWDADSAEANSTLPVPSCDGRDTRIVSWGNLVLMFAGPVEDQVFVDWVYGFDPVRGDPENVRGIDLYTEDGIGLGSRRPDVTLVLGSRVVIVDDPAIDVASFTIDGDDEDHITGLFTSVDPDAPVQTLAHAPGCDDPG
jgi:hypothetical protein